MTFPRTWDGPQFKQPKSAKVVKVKAARKHKALEDGIMREARVRDKVCRFPLCGCRKLGLRLEVSHQQHRGMGGNPAGDRTDTAILVLLCSARHKENIVSIDNKGLRWTALTRDGADGPIAWDVDMRAFGGKWEKAPRWKRVARETARGGPWDVLDRETLEQLAGMEL